MYFKEWTRTRLHGQHLNLLLLWAMCICFVFHLPVLVLVLKNWSWCWCWCRHCGLDYKTVHAQHRSESSNWYNDENAKSHFSYYWDDNDWRSGFRLLEISVNAALYCVITQSRGYHFQRRLCVCLSVCLFSHDIWKSDAAKITELDMYMFHDESWKPIYFGVNRPRDPKNSAVLAWVIMLLWLLASS